MLFTMIADQVDTSRRLVCSFTSKENSQGLLSRTRYMYIMNAGPHVSGLITPAVEAFTMSVNVWFPFFVGIGAYLLMYLVIFAMPDCKPIPKSNEEESLSLETDPTVQINLESHVVVPSTGTITTMLKTPNLVICFLLFLLKRTGFMSEILFYQYASAKFNLKLRQTPWFRSVKAIGSILVLSLVLPTITTIFHQRRHNPSVIDSNVIRGSCLIMVVAFLSIYLASSPWFFAFGRCFDVRARKILLD